MTAGRRRTTVRSFLLRGAEVDGRRTDVLVRDGRVVPVDGRRVDEVVECAGGALLPGLVDHHLHLHALAAAERSVRCPSDPAALGRVLAAAAGDVHGWVRGVGFPGDDLDVDLLDRLHPSRPVRVQHRSGALWVLNTAALERIGPLDHPGVERVAGAPTGRILRGDDWLRSRLPPAEPFDLAALGARLAGLGLTALTDATPDVEAGAARSLTAVPQRLTLLGVPLGETAPEGTVTGPYKMVLADSGLPDLDELTDRIRAAHAAQRPVAVHTVTRESLVLLLAALDDAGRLPGDRVEHAALVPAELIGELRGLAVVTQPGFLADRGDLFRREVPAVEHPDLYRCASLRDHGVPVAFSSDAPYGPVDPWRVIDAAVTRATPDGDALGPGEAVSARDALDLYLAGRPGGPVRRVTAGAEADLVLMHEPLDVALQAPSMDGVRQVWIGGVPMR
ncbi:amidohydrolase family protein [Pseudonocardia sp. ICBG162]|uniref:amidohydrolase family protein n=1 Tax=Pseudonocardia sp. ICBG162 TaxID=2846761 RepID=UPI001CF64186|nr:amidohydrolase family protein [Pseudonocardia sp. ICBG162]